MEADGRLILQRCGPFRINFDRMIMCRVLRQIRHKPCQSQLRNIKRALPRRIFRRNFHRPVTREGKLTGERALGPFIDHTADRVWKMLRFYPVFHDIRDCQLTRARLGAGFIINSLRQTYMLRCVCLCPTAMRSANIGQRFNICHILHMRR